LTRIPRGVQANVEQVKLLQGAEPVSTPEEAGRFLDRVLAPCWKVPPTPALYRRSLELQERYSLSFHDALIVAALEAGCKRIWSADLQHGQRIEGLPIEDPFRA